MIEKRVHVDPRLSEAVDAKNELKSRFMDPVLEGYDPIFGMVVLGSGAPEVVVHTREEMPEELRERLTEGLGVNVRYEVFQAQHEMGTAPSSHQAINS